jgi:hypothetical protein
MIKEQCNGTQYILPQNVFRYSLNKGESRLLKISRNFFISLVDSHLVIILNFSSKYFSQNIWRGKIKYYLCSRFPKTGLADKKVFDIIS